MIHRKTLQNADELIRSVPTLFIESIKQRMSDELEQPIFQRDPHFITRHLPTFEQLSKYFRAEVRGFEHMPTSGPFLAVGNHSGGMYTPDAYVFMTHWFRQRPIEDPVYSLAHSFIFATPAANFFRKIGAIPANFENAERALDLGAPILVYPGGDWEAYRPFAHRNKIDFGGRTGFVRLALRRQIPVVPVVAHGSHQSIIVLSRGDRLARAMQLERLRIKIFPLVLSFPWGLTPAFVPAIPLPSKITVDVCPPLDWRHYGPSAHEDPEIVQRCYAEMESVMQERLDQLAKERPFPILRG